MSKFAQTQLSSTGNIGSQSIQGDNMNKKILVAYASKYGTTKEIAEKITEVLQAAGLEAELQPANTVKKLDSYGAVVLGSAVYVGMWRKGAVKFLKTHEAALSKLPVWLFSSGPTGEGDPLELLKGWRFPEKHRPIIDRIQPHEVTVFHGALDMDVLNPIHKSMIKTVKATMGDFRDWDAITEWAQGIAKELSDETPK
jgi:menaquinone-dependent protoporphyrinogen oxidase